MCEGRLGMMWKIISSCAGFHTGPLPLSHNFPYPEILKWSMVIILGVHDMQQASRKAESGDHKHAVNDT